MENNRLNHCS